MNQKELYWQKIRGATILAVIFIHCQSAINAPLNSLNGCLYFILRNLVNFPVNMFFFISGFFLKPTDNKYAFYKKRLPKLVSPYLFYTFAYLSMSILGGGSISMRRIIYVLLFGTASTPLYYIVVLTYFTLLAPFLLKAVKRKKLSIIIIASTPVFLIFAYVIRFTGTDVWNYLKYTPVWLSFYYLGMVIKEHKPTFKKTTLMILLLVSFITELASTALLSNIENFNEYTQLRFAGAFYSLILILLVYEYSKKTKKDDNCKLLTMIGDDSYAIYYMHCAFLTVFTKVIPFGDNMILLLYQLGEIVFAVLMCELVVFILKKVIKNKKVRMIFGV